MDWGLFWIHWKTHHGMTQVFGSIFWNIQYPPRLSYNQHEPIKSLKIIVVFFFKGNVGLFRTINRIFIYLCKTERSGLIFLLSTQPQTFINCKIRTIRSCKARLGLPLWPHAYKIQEQICFDIFKIFKICVDFRKAFNLCLSLVD